MNLTTRRYLLTVPVLLLGTLLLSGSAPLPQSATLQTLLQINTPTDSVKFEPGTSLFLEPNFPNPFVEKTTIAFTLDETAVVTLKVYDAFYNPVRTLIDAEERSAGRYPVEFDTKSRLASGMYFYTLEIEGGEKLTRRMLVRR